MIPPSLNTTTRNESSAKKSRAFLCKQVGMKNKYKHQSLDQLFLITVHSLHFLSKQSVFYEWIIIHIDELTFCLTNWKTFTIKQALTTIFDWQILDRENAFLFLPSLRRDVCSRFASNESISIGLS